MKQILIVANYAPSFGGNWLQSMKALEKNKDIHVRYLFPEAAAKQYWIKEINRSYFTDWSLSSLKEVWKKINKDAPVDIVHFHFVGGKNGLLCRMAFTGSCRFLWHVHNHDISRGRLAPVKDILKKWMYRDSFKIGVSDSVSDSVRVLSPRNVQTLYNAIDFERLSDVGEEHFIDKAPGVIRCMIMGNHFERKGNDIAAKAIRKIISGGGVPAELYIVANEHYRNDLAAFLTKTIGNDSWQKYIKRLSPRNDIATYYRKMDCFLSPSREEGFTYSVAEAAYCGCQVILSQCPGQEEYLKHSIPSFHWLQDPNTVDITDDLTQEILKAYKMPQGTKEEMVRESQKYLESHFKMNKWVEDVVKIYDELMK